MRKVILINYILTKSEFHNISPVSRKHLQLDGFLILNAILLFHDVIPMFFEKKKYKELNCPKKIFFTINMQ